MFFSLAAFGASAFASGVERIPLEAGQPFIIPEGWSSMGPTDPNTKLELIFAVKQTNVDKLETALMEVSDPRSPKYGKHMSNDAVHKLVAPAPSTLEAVNSFLHDNEVLNTTLSLSPNSDLLSVTVPVSIAEAMLNAKYVSYQHKVSKYIAHRAASYSLPSAVAEAVDFVSPTVRFPPINPAPKVTSVGAGLSSNLGVSPTALRKIYSVNDVVGSAPKNKHAVTAFLNQKFRPSDLKEFWRLYMSGVNASLPMVKEVGDEVEGALAGVESMLDIEYINAIAAGVESEFWGFSGQSPDNPQNEPFLKWLAVVSNTSDTDIPLIFSTSYGEDEESTTIETATRTNTEFMKAGARGISLLFASGDSGAAAVTGPKCPGGKFVPKWPAGSPYVTGVGGTQGDAGDSAAGLASGGFCNRWSLPSWQSGAVNTYVAQGSSAGLPPSSYFNASGRGFPDVSAQAVGFTVVANGIPLPGVAGTSCASPSASGVFALLNDVRLRAGKSSLGFLNPFIYQNMASFNDITKGAGNGCGAGGQKGFPATKGWDPVTGVGSPNYVKLSAVVEMLP
jgi:tripeptidyl-peptidase-1